MKQRAVLIAVVALLAMPALGARLGSISGYVRDAHGTAQLGAMVVLIPPEPSLPVRVFTDSKGHFAAENLEPGRYQVKASAVSFLPTLRENVSLHAGAGLVLNLTLNTLFEALQMLPVHSRTAQDQDDWKWTLRSMANRPILRVVDGSPMMVSENTGENHPTLRAKVEFVAGAANNGLGSSDQQSTSFAVQRSLFSADTLDINGNTGATVTSPQVLRVAYSHQFASGERPQIALTARRFLIEANGNDHAEMDAYALTASDLVRLTDFAELSYGTEYQTIQFLGRAAAIRPFGSLDVHLSPDTVVEYSYSSSVPDSRLGKGFDSAPADLSESGPRLSMTAFTPRLERAGHQEVSVSQRMGANAFQLAAFSDHLSNAALVGLGDDAADDNSGAVLADPYSQSFTYYGGTLSTGGVRAVAQRQIDRALKATLDVSYGGVLALDRNSNLVLGNAPAEFAHVKQTAVTGKLAGTIGLTKTQWIASYKWNSGQRALTAVDAFNASAGAADPFLGFFIRQPLPSPGFMPGTLEAVVDVRNLLAQGYLPVLGEDGHTLYLVQSARSIRGGLAFNF